MIVRTHKPRAADGWTFIADARNGAHLRTLDPSLPWVAFLSDGSLAVVERGGREFRLKVFSDASATESQADIPLGEGLRAAIGLQPSPHLLWVHVLDGAEEGRLLLIDLAGERVLRTLRQPLFPVFAFFQFHSTDPRVPASTDFANTFVSGESIARIDPATGTVEWLFGSGR
jgi:hypothetical protein